MKSTTHERLAACRRVTEHPPAAVRAVVATIERVTEVRIRLLTCLMRKKRWDGDLAVAFVRANGDVWR
ncbi:hypothetical protein DU506_19935 [Vreelandella rituensis]|uniref:Uncharacterized protein n=1 Tax=Vreelandella rituensis TaxID=2282306 RepID=A0A368TMQ2_9GAMM|nr:hypothetical protein [Clostridia bacterium]RCV85871.1 hypothetical protein DU506_19935 [Halomonas rituensis]